MLKKCCVLFYVLQHRMEVWMIFSNPEYRTRDERSENIIQTDHSMLQPHCKLVVCSVQNTNYTFLRYLLTLFHLIIHTFSN